MCSVHVHRSQRDAIIASTEDKPRHGTRFGEQSADSYKKSQIIPRSLHISYGYGCRIAGEHPRRGAGLLESRHPTRATPCSDPLGL